MLRLSLLAYDAAKGWSAGKSEATPAEKRRVDQREACELIIAISVGVDLRYTHNESRMKHPVWNSGLRR